MQTALTAQLPETRPASDRRRTRGGRRVWLGWVLLTLVTAAMGSTARAASDRWETLQAIHWVENPDNDPRPGRHGELGAYQFRLSTWRMHTKLPFAYARDREHADQVAVKHYEWLRRGLQRNGLEPSPYRIALAWNAGLTATVRGRAPGASHRYAEQVSNLVESLKQRSAGP